MVGSSFGPRPEGHRQQSEGGRPDSSARALVEAWPGAPREPACARIVGWGSRCLAARLPVANRADDRGGHPARPRRLTAMLDPHDRQLLLDLLRPPAGYQVDHALATTFSLDLIALLLAPLAFSLFELREADGEPAPDRMAWLEAIRRHADHLTVFCQAGQIAVPRHEQLLFGYLEDSVY